MTDTPEPENIELPAPPVRVPVTPEWLAEQAEKQRRYRQQRIEWNARVPKLKDL